MTELKAAYEIKPLTALLLNIGHAYLDWGRPAQARDYYDLYLATDKKLSPAQRAEVEKYRADALAKLTEQQAQQAQQAKQAKQAQQAAQQPPPPAVTPPAPVVPPAPKTEVKAGPPTGPIVLLSSGAALLVIGLGLGGGALAASKEVVQGDGTFDTALDSRGRTLNSAGIAFDVLGGAAFAAGAVWGISWLVKHRRDPNVTPVASLRLVPSGAGLLVQGRF